MHLYGDRFHLAPLTVLVDPFRLKEAFKIGGTRNFPESVYYIFHKQLEEADAIAINKSDLISSGDLRSLESQVSKQFPEIPVFCMSAKTGAGLDSWLAFVESGADTGRRIAEVDYDVYAEGEAVLGWLNARLQIESPNAIDWEAFAGKLLHTMKESLQTSQVEAAHVKLFLSTDDGSVVANLTTDAAEPVIHGNGRTESRKSELLVNARVNTPPDNLRTLVERSLQVAAGNKMATRVLSLESFSPSRPQPTHRYRQVAA